MLLNCFQTPFEHHLYSMFTAYLAGEVATLYTPFLYHVHGIPFRRGCNHLNTICIAYLLGRPISVQVLFSQDLQLDGFKGDIANIRSTYENWFSTVDTTWLKRITDNENVFESAPAGAQSKQNEQTNRWTSNPARPTSSLVFVFLTSNLPAPICFRFMG